jgi:hypothetical protein
MTKLQILFKHNYLFLAADFKRYSDLFEFWRKCLCRIRNLWHDAIHRQTLLQFVQEWQLLWERCCCVQDQENVLLYTFKSNDSPTIRRSKELRLIWKSTCVKCWNWKMLYKIISQHSGTLIKSTKIASVIIGWLLKKQKNTEWLMKYWKS